MHSYCCCLRTKYTNLYYYCLQTKFREVWRRYNEQKKGVIMCANCSYGQMEKTTTTHTVNIDNNLIIIKNVPCNECLHCGDVFYENITAKKIEQIVNKEKNNNKDLTVVDYVAA